MNNYEKGKRLIADSNFSLKKVKTFRGHDGDGVNADVYHDKKKIAEVDDDGWGGGLSIHYFENGEWTKAGGLKIPQTITDFLKTLPTHSYKEHFADVGFSVDEDDKDEVMEWNVEDLFNELIESVLERREFKKLLRKVCALKESEGEKTIVSWKHKSSDLKKIYRTKNGVATLSEILSKEGTKILNLLPEEEAFALLRKHG